MAGPFHMRACVCDAVERGLFPYKHTEEIAVRVLYSLVLLAGRNPAFDLNDKESCMTHSITEEDPIDIVHADNRKRDESVPGAKPEGRIARGVGVEDIFGMCAEEFDDEYMEAVLAIRRGVWPKDRRP
jgi:hypothetical protein